MADSAEPAPQSARPPAAGAAGPGSLLDRPIAERRREFKYRFAQSVVFGAPVLALQWFGRSLGGAESDRWVGLFQSLLAGWVVCVAATGMLAEGLLLVLARRRIPKPLLADFVVALVAFLTYVTGLLRFIALGAIDARIADHSFAVTVALLAAWTGLRWWHLAKRNSAG